MPNQEELRQEAFVRAAEILRPYEPALANEIEHGCLHLHPGEPFFSVRAQDITAPATVDAWMLANQSTAPELKIETAREVADRMRRWAGPRKNAD